jgi:HlyD family secretion protein
MDNNTTVDSGIKTKKRFRAWFTKKKIIWTIIILLIVGFIIYRYEAGKNTSGNIQTAVATKQDIQQTVLSTGQVVSSTDLNLGFQASGVVTQVLVKAGDKVKAGQTLATLNQASAAAAVTTAQGSLALAQANYEKVVNGSTNTQIAVTQQAVNSAQVALNNASTTLATTQAQQATAVKNAYNTLLNTSITAIPASGNSDTVTPIITGTYTGANTGVYNITLYATGGGVQFQASGLETANGNVRNQPTQMGNLGLYIQFNSTPAVGDIWTVNIPNTYASTYVANYNAYQTALQAQASAISAAQGQVQSAQSALAQAQATLNNELAQASSAEIDSAKAQILSAQGQVASAQATFNNTILKAPLDGTITQVDTKVGEQASSLAEVMILQDIGDLHAESDVSEADIASLQPGQPVDFTFDALGPDRHFAGTVLTINPASTVISGVVNYLVKATLPSIPDIKPGMTANMTILVAKKSGVLAVPSSAIINQNNNQYVRVVDDIKKGTYHQVQVQTGLSADGGLVEITSGISEGATVVTYIKQ